MNSGNNRKDMEWLKRKYPEISLLNEPLAPYTTYRVGGPVDLLIFPQEVEQLSKIIRYCYEKRVPYFILGKGANILVHDNGFRGVVINLEKCCAQLYHEGHKLYAGSGVLVKDLVAYCEAHGLSGLDYMSGIPGTVGGALTMNAGAFVGEIGDRVVYIEALDEKGTAIRINQKEAEFGYRRADGLKGKVLLGCLLSVEPGDAHRLASARQNYLQRRADKQPLEYPSCGSVFKRPAGDYAGRLIEAAECKGLTVGGAKVSEKHANFILNYKNASARDIYRVIRQVQDRVYQKFGVWLELEVKLIGFPEAERKKVEGPLNANQKTQVSP